MNNIEDYVISINATCREAMKRIDKNEIKILFIVNENKLVCSLTDGDIRRYLLSGGALEDQVITAPKFAYNEKEAKSLYDEKNYIAIPIVNQKMLIKDIFLGSTKRIYKKIPKMEVVINAGGKGTRLEPYTKVLPKPLIPVGELPIIEHIMNEYEKYGLKDFSIIVNYKKELIKAYFKETKSNYNLTWYDEKKPLGTVGGLSLLKGRISDTFFFINCDILLQTDYYSMVNYHKEHKNAITMVCAYKNITIPYGVINMGKNGTIEEMKEKPELSFLTNTGVYIVEPEVLDDIETDVPIGFPDIIKKEQLKGKKVGVYPISENDWMDMGQMEELKKMRERLYGKE